MPTVRNPTDQDLLCSATGTIVPARGVIGVSAEVAALVPLTIFEVSADPARVEPAVVESPPAEPVVIDPVVEAELLAAAKQIEADQAASPGA